MGVDKIYNLLDESWIPVRLTDFRIIEVSLLDIFFNAEHYVDLACASSTENVALLRFLLGIMHTVLSRYEYDGEALQLASEDDALDRWKDYWEKRHFSEEVFKNYLEEYRERFWLFHPDFPFMQVNEAKIGTEYSAAKLNPEIMESSNKIKLFSLKNGDEKYESSFSEAVRGLIHINAYDDKTSKPKGKNLPSIGVGWVGELGIVYVTGENLFETLMLNTCLIDENDEISMDNRPIWENIPNCAERNKIVFPQNQAELLTLQSRRLFLKRNAARDKVVGFYLLGGDIVSRENAFGEQMTFWRKSKPDKSGKINYYPKPFDPERLIWRDFPAIFYPDQGNKMPGIVHWLKRLGKERLIDKNICYNYRFVSAIYDQYPIKDVYLDELSFYLDILEELDPATRNMIADEIEKIEETVTACGKLEKEIRLASGGDEGSGLKAKEQMYTRIDRPFRLWLSTLQSCNMIARNEKRENWERRLKQIALNFGKDLVSMSGQRAFMGRTVNIKIKNKEVSKHFSSPEAYDKYKNRIYELLKGSN